MSRREEIAELALELSQEDRAYLADVLEQSLQGGGFASPEIATAWRVEIERRLEAYDRGEMRAVDGEESLSRVREQLVARRVARETRTRRHPSYWLDRIGD